MTAHAFDLLKHEILTGNLRPGQHLRLGEIRTKYGLGITPLREALTRLAAHHLVIIEDQRGFRVAEASVNDMKDVTKTRKTIEIFLLAESIDRGDENWVRNIEVSFERLKRLGASPIRPAGEEWEIAHKDFHFSLTSAAQAPLLQNFHDVSWDKSSRYRLLEYCPDDIDLIMAEHMQLMDAAIAREKSLACAILERHIRIWSGAALAALISSSKL